jgi:hypothetical protein
MFTFNGIGTRIYGRAKRQKLTGAEGLAAEQAGYLPASYQVVKWFVFLFLPVVPLGSYRVMKAHPKFFTADQFSMQRVELDRRQVAVHYAVAYGWILGWLFLAFLS